jgi:CheY-like chemotaxis protein/HPt (histidine-containing phosphotransfer) domain-containing protein
LTGVQVFPVGLSDGELEIVATYLGAAGAAVRDGAGLAEVEERGVYVRQEGGVCLVLIRDSLDTLQTLDRLRSSGADLSRIVVAVPRALLSTIGHARRSGVGSFLPLPMPREQLILAVAVAAGRVDASRSGGVRSNPDAQWVAPSVEVAVANEALVQVVEDNPTNQEIIARILKRLGYAFRIASNGREALDQLARGGAALVLTDYHMPLMDGFALARAIRKKEAGTGERMPIVALTADAMSRTERHCLDAGMDGFLTKPVNVPALRAVLEKWNPRGKELRGRPDGDRATVASAASRLPATAVPDEIDFERIEAVFGGLDAECMEMLRSFEKSLATRIGSIESALTAGDAASARDICHATKGAAASIGATRVAEAFGRVQASIDAGRPETAAADLSQLAAAASALGRALADLERVHRRGPV